MDQDRRIPQETTRIEKDLGIMISEDGSYSAQVTRALSKANTILGRLLNTFKYFDRKIVKILYPTFVRPHIESASTVWNDLKKEDKDRLEKFQRKVTRKITDIKHTTYEERLEILSLQKYEDRRLRGDLIQIFKMINLIDDIKLSQDLKFLSSSRPNNKKLIRELSRNSLRHGFLTNRVTETWNKLPQEIVNSETVNSFKGKLDKFMKENKQYKNVKNI